MVTPMHWRVLLVALVGAASYLGLLHVSYSLLEGAYTAPPWWGVHRRPITVGSWFVLINATGAVLAAIPIAIGVTIFASAHRKGVSLLVGLLPSLYIVGGGWVQYGLPKYPAAWVVEAFQFLSIGLAVLLLVLGFSSRPLTTASSAA